MCMSSKGTSKKLDIYGNAIDDGDNNTAHEEMMGAASQPSSNPKDKHQIIKTRGGAKKNLFQTILGY